MKSIFRNTTSCLHRSLCAAVCLLLLAAGLSVAQETPSVEEVTESPTGTTTLGKVIWYSIIGTGVLAFEAGGFTRSLSVEAGDAAGEAWDAYISSGAQNNTIITGYEESYETYRGLSVLSDILWGSGAGVLSLSVFIAPPDVYQLSLLGRIVLTGSLAVGLTSNMFDQWADHQLVANNSLWDKFKASGSSDLKADYAAGYELYRTMRITSFALGVLSGVGVAGSFFLPGESRPLNGSLLDKILITGGMAFFTGGSLMNQAAQRALVEADEAWSDYLETGGDNGQLRSKYQSTYDRYIASTFLSYGLWFGGGAMLATAIMAPDTALSVDKPESAVTLDIQPTHEGAAVGLSIKL